MRPRSSIAAAIAVVFPPGDAQASSTRSPARAATRDADELRGFVLHDEHAGVGERRQQRIALADDPGVGREAAGSVWTPWRPSDSASASPVVRSRFTRSVSGAGWLSKCTHASAAAKP